MWKELDLISMVFSLISKAPSVLKRVQFDFAGVQFDTKMIKHIIVFHISAVKRKVEGTE